MENSHDNKLNRIGIEERKRIIFPTHPHSVYVQRSGIELYIRCYQMVGGRRRAEESFDLQVGIAIVYREMVNSGVLYFRQSLPSVLLSIFPMKWDFVYSTFYSSTRSWELVPCLYINISFSGVVAFSRCGSCTCYVKVDVRYQRLCKVSRR